jgi:uncharacterized repeat protein (TIGR03803 family)
MESTKVNLDRTFRVYTRICVVMLLLIPSAWSSEPTGRVLHNFLGSPNDGYLPQAALVFDAAGNLYGTTGSGGNAPCSCGTVYQLTPNGDGTWTENILYNFLGGDDGFGPIAPLVFDSAGNLYGTTGAGGGSANCQDGCGTVFELSPNSGGTWTEQIIHVFTGRDGVLPLAVIFDTAGNLYGTTIYGGTGPCHQGDQLGCGIVFELSSSGGGWTETVLYNFTDGNDGGFPATGLTFDSAGRLYGTTSSGGPGLYHNGTVFELSPRSNGRWIEKVLHGFNGTTDGGDPMAGVIFDSHGNLFGTARGAGARGCGTVFELTSVKAHWHFQVIYALQGQRDGCYAESAVAFDPAGNLWTNSNGSSDMLGAFGAVFELAPYKGGGLWKFKWSHVFRIDGLGGSAPFGGLIVDNVGNVYGVTLFGGTANDGVVYEIVTQ